MTQLSSLSYTERATLTQVFFQMWLQSRSKSSPTSNLQAVEAELMHDLCKALATLTAANKDVRREAWRQILNTAQEAIAASTIPEVNQPTCGSAVPEVHNE